MEEAKDELLQWSPIVRKHVDTLVMELTKKDALQLVYRAEDHAQALKIEAQAVYRCVSLCVREGDVWCFKCTIYAITLIDIFQLPPIYIYHLLHHCALKHVAKDIYK